MLFFQFGRKKYFFKTKKFTNLFKIIKYLKKKKYFNHLLLIILILSFYKYTFVFIKI